MDDLELKDERFLKALANFALDIREIARKQKNFALADSVRKIFTDFGVNLEDAKLV